MEQLNCGYLRCKEPLSSADEIVTGYCSRHQEELASKKYITGVCWACGSITIIQSRAEQPKFRPPDKYLFARGCERCTGIQHEGIMWMTIKANSKPESAVTPEGKIVHIESQTISNKDHNLVKEESRRQQEMPTLDLDLAQG